MYQSRNVQVSDVPSLSTTGLRSAPISLSIPQGKAVARPADRLSEEDNAKIKRAQYGGDGDKAHLGK